MTDEITPVVPGTATETPQENKGVKTFTQEDIDRIVTERLKDERKKYADYADLKKKADQWQQFEDSQKSEQQKLQEQLATLQQQSQQANTKRDEALMRAAIVASAAKAGMADPADAFAMLDKSALKIEGDTVQGVDEAITALVKSKPYLLSKQAPNLPAGNPAGQDQKPDLSWMNHGRKQVSRGGVVYSGKE